MKSLTGQNLGPYRVLGQLGRGGMATVYKAYQPSLDRQVALKVLPPHLADEPGFSERFQREARAVASLEHPHILAVYDSGQEGDVAYLVMRFVDGGTLKAQTGHPLTIDRIIHILDQVSKALDYAHTKRFVHRDVKPSNVLMDHGDWALLSDFGLAKMIGGSTQITETGVGLGTPDYMSPEQGMGSQVDQRTDIYSLAVILYEMLTGQVPYQADTPMAVVMKHIHEPLPLPTEVNPSISQAVERVVLKGMAKDPDDRYKTAGDLISALREASSASQQLQADLPISTLPPVDQADREPTDEEVARSKRLLWLVPVALAAVAVGAFAITSLPGCVSLLGGRMEFGECDQVAQVQSEESQPLSDGEAASIEPTLPAARAADSTSETDTKDLADLGEPVVWLLPADDSDVWDETSGSFANLLQQETGINAEIQMAQEFPSMLDALCDGSVDVSFIDHSQYLIARDQQCVEVELTAIRFDSPTFAGQLLARTELGLETVAEMAGREFCRPGPLSVSGWFIPRLMLLSEGIDPDRDFSHMIDIGPNREVIDSLHRGECEVGATFKDARENSEIGAEVFDTVTVLDVSPDIPRHAIAYSVDLRAADRDRITRFMFELAEKEGGLELLNQLFLGASGFEPIDDAAYDGLRELIEAAGLTVYSHNP